MLQRTIIAKFANLFNILLVYELTGQHTETRSDSGL